MKKFTGPVKLALSMVLLIVVVASLTGCGKKSPEDLLEDASKKIEAADSLAFENATVKTEVKTADNNASMTIGFSGQYIKSKTDNPADFQAKVDMYVEALGGKNSVTAFIKDGTIYSDEGSHKLKQSLGLSQEDIKRLVGLNDNLKLKNFVKKSKQDGDKVILNLDGAKFIETYMKDTEDKVPAQVSQALALLKAVKIDDMIIEATIVKEQLTAIKYNFAMELNGALVGTPGNDVKIEVSFDIPKITTNSVKSIDFPNFDEYIEVPSIDLPGLAPGGAQA